MKAVRIHEFGGLEVMKLEEIERPVPAPDEILVKVYASGVNPVDWAIRSGTNEALKPLMPLPMILGWDAAGVVEECGSEVTRFQKGDAVYGVPNFPGTGGSYAEYCAAKATRFALKPKSLSFNEAAGVPLVALTAWTGMFEYGKLQGGQRILIQGASGSVGISALQFAKAKGAYAIAIGSGNNVDYLKSLGADEIIDYTTQKYEDLVQDIDVVLEASSLRDNNERLKLITVLKEGGILVSVNTDFPFNDEVLQRLKDKGVTGEQAANEPRREWLEEMSQLIDEGKMKVVISKVFPLEQVAEAHLAGESRQVKGKMVLEVRKEEVQA